MPRNLAHVLISVAMGLALLGCGQQDGSSATSEPSDTVTTDCGSDAAMALLPDQLGGATVEKSAVSGADLISQDTREARKLAAMIAVLGASPDDITVATAAAPGATATLYCVPGEGPAALDTAYRAYLATEEVAGLDLESMAVGTRSATVRVPGRDHAFIAEPGQLIAVQVSDAAHLAEILGGLP